MPGDESPDGEAGGKRRLPRIISFLALHMLIGIAFGIAVAALLLLADVGGLKSLIAASDAPVLAIAMLYVMFALTFGSLSMGVAIMRLPYGPDGPDKGPDHSEEGDHPEK